MHVGETVHNRDSGRTVRRQSINYPDAGYDVRTFASLTVGRAQHFPIVLNGTCIGGSCNTRRMHPGVTDRVYIR